MEMKVILVLCALVFLICSARLRAESTSESPTTLAPGPSKGVVSATPIPQITAVTRGSIQEFIDSPENSNVSVANTSSHPSSTLGTPLTGEPTIDNRNGTTNGTAEIIPVSTPQTTPLTSTASSNQLTNTDLPVTTASVSSSPSASSFVPENLTQSQSPVENLHPTSNSLSTSSPPPVHSSPHTTVLHSSTQSSTPPRSAPTPAPTTSSLQTSVTAPAKTHSDTPSQLNVGDDDTSQSVHSSGSSLDPLLAGLVSVFIVSAAIISLLLFLKFRQRYERPEFRRLQDLPMDDMMEDTPLSMYSY